MTLRKGLTTLVFFGIGLGLFWLAMQVSKILKR